MMEVVTEKMKDGGQIFQRSEWMDGLDAVLNPLDRHLVIQGNPHVDANYGHSYFQGSQFSFDNVSSGHQSPADSRYAASGPDLPPDLSPFSFNQQPWFDDSGNLLGSLPTSVEAEKSSGFVRSSGLHQSYPTLQSYSEQQQEQQQERKLDTRLNINEVSSALRSKESSGNLSIASQSRVSSPSGDGSRLKVAVGDKYVRRFETFPEAAAAACQQRELVRSTNGLNSNIIQAQQIAPREQQLELGTFGSQPEDSGLHLVYLLVACAEAIQRGERPSAQDTLGKINHVVSVASQQQDAGPMVRVAAHFAEALTRRIYGVSPSRREALLTAAGIKADTLSELLQFYEICPFLKFAHFTANQSILDAFKDAKYVHVIDFNLNHGLQWPALIQALALRPGGPPSLKLTGIGPPDVCGDDSLQEIGMSLSQLAESLNVPFQFRGIVANKLDEVKPWMLQVRPGEVVAVNSMFQLHKLLYTDDAASSGARGIDEVLRAVKSLNPKVVAIAEQEANHNSNNFLDRFMEALHFYSSMFDSLEPSNYASNRSEQMLVEMYLGKEMCNIVACEGAERTERHETLEQWRLRMLSAGFQQVRMGPNAFKHASMLLTLFSSQGYRVEDNRGCLTLCWHGRPLLATSAWHSTV